LWKVFFHQPFEEIHGKNVRDQGFYDENTRFNASNDFTFTDNINDYDHRLGYDYSDMNIR